MAPRLLSWRLVMKAPRTVPKLMPALVLLAGTSGCTTTVAGSDDPGEPEANPAELVRMMDVDGDGTWDAVDVDGDGGDATGGGGVTVRDRDTLQQERVAPERLREYIAERVRA